MTPFAIWITGLPASGKSTVRAEVVRQLEASGIHVAVLESDELRKTFSEQPQYNDLERDFFYRSMVFIGRTLLQHGVPVVFDATIFENVTLWDEEAPANLDRFSVAIHKASIAEFIGGLPNGRHSALGNNGINISGGQKQRISIARELYKDIDLLIMDEATSALDSETEGIIQDNIDTLKGTITILIVAHRLSTIKNADRIVLMKQGRIDCVGAYDQLLRQSPDFRRMVELQQLR